MKTVIVTDNGAGFSADEIKKLGIKTLSLRFFIDEVEYDDFVSDEIFFDKIISAKTISTSQPSISDVEEVFKDLLKEYDNILYMPMSSGLSGTYNTGKTIEKDFDGKVFTVDTRKISVLQKFAVLDAIDFINRGISPSEIRNIFEKNKNNTSIYIMVDTLDFLKKGGRVSPLVAKIGNLLQIKPIMFSDGGKFEVAKKERTVKNAKEKMIELIKDDMKGKFGDMDTMKYMLGVAYTSNVLWANELRDSIKENFGEFKREIPVDSLAKFISCHIGPNAIGVAIYKNLNEN